MSCEADDFGGGDERAVFDEVDERERHRFEWACTGLVEELEELKGIGGPDVPGSRRWRR